MIRLLKDEEDNRVIHGGAESIAKEQKDRVLPTDLIQEILKDLSRKRNLMIFNADIHVLQIQHQKTPFSVLELVQIERQILRIETRIRILEQRVDLRHLNKARDWKTPLKKVRIFILR